MRHLLVERGDRRVHTSAHLLGEQQFAGQVFREARELALQMLYQLDVTGEEDVGAGAHFEGSPEALRAMFPNPPDVLAWIKDQEDAVLKSGFDANDWIAQTRAYDAHNVGTTPGFGGDHLKALAGVKAKTLIVTGGQLDLYNPVEEAQEAARYIPDARLVTIPSVQGHVAASPAKAADVEFMNRTVRDFLDAVTDRGRKLQ